MNLAPIYELRSRLRASMIAGTNLLSEDFRLKRAVEEIKPLEALSPVFAKISQMAGLLVTEGSDNKEVILMDTITLVDALLCTQGQVAVSGEVKTIESGSCGSVITNAPYSVVKGLVEALTTSGNGHYQFVLDTHEQKPQLFEDYRVKSAMVDALGASYAELADRVANWMKQESEEILPLLQKKFDPKGKREMVRRVQVMEAVAGGKANEFYVKMLPEAEKDVRNELIYALRFRQENVELLLELVKSEKGKAKKMAHYALAEMEDARAEKIFVDMYAKKPAEAMSYLNMTTTKWASKLVAASLIKVLAPCMETDGGKTKKVYTEKEVEAIRRNIEALVGKNGEEICEAYRKVAAIPDIYYLREIDGKVQSWYMDIVNRRKRYQSRPGGGACTMAFYLEMALRIYPQEDLCALALELYEKEENAENKNLFFTPAVIAKLYEKEDCSEWLRNQLFERSLIGQKKKKELSSFLGAGLRGVGYDKIRKEYYLQSWERNEATEDYVTYRQPVTQNMGDKVSDVLIEYCAEESDVNMIHFVNREDVENCNKLEDYFYKRALTGPVASMRHYWEGLRACGSKRCAGLLERFATKSGKEMSGWEVSSSITSLPGTVEALEEETNKVYQMIQEGKIKLRYWREDSFQEYVRIAKEQAREQA